MGISKPISALLFFLPICVVGVFSVSVRDRISPYSAPEYGPRVHGQIAQYSPILRKVGVTANGTSLRVQDAEETLDDWIALARLGELPMIPAADSEDVGRDGIRGQIVQAHYATILSGLREAERLAEEGKNDEAMSIFHKTVTVANLLKYMCAQSVIVTCTVQKRLLRLGARLASKGDSTLEHRARFEVSRMTCSPSLVRDQQIRNLSRSKPLDRQMNQRLTNEIYEQFALEPSVAQAKAKKTPRYAGASAMLLVTALKEELSLQVMLEEFWGQAN